MSLCTFLVKVSGLEFPHSFYSFKANSVIRLVNSRFRFNKIRDIVNDRGRCYLFKFGDRWTMIVITEIIVIVIFNDWSFLLFNYLCDDLLLNFFNCLLNHWWGLFFSRWLSWRLLLLLCCLLLSALFRCRRWSRLMLHPRWGNVKGILDRWNSRECSSRLVTGFIGVILDLCLGGLFFETLFLWLIGLSYKTQASLILV